MSVVTEEALNIALIAYHRIRPHEGVVVAMRAALAAVAPLIAAAERERCARVCDAFPARTHGALATAPYAAAEQAADEIAAATVAALAEALEECADDLEAEISSRYSAVRHYACMAADEKRDMEPVIRARAALAAAQPPSQKPTP